MGERLAAHGASDRLLEKAVAAFRTDRREEAERLCRRVLAHEPRSLPATHMLGMLAAQTGRTELAINLMREVVAREPHSREALDQLAALLRCNGQGAEAIELCKTALRVDPKHAPTHYNLALAYLAERRPTEAVSFLRRAVTLEPGSVPMRLDLAAALLECGETDAAEAALRQAITLAPANANSHRRLGVLLGQCGRFEEAVAEFEQAIALDPHCAANYHDLVYVKKVGHKDRPLISRMVSLLGKDEVSEEDRALLHFALGKACDDLADYGSAIDHFDEGHRIEANRLRLNGQAVDRAAMAAGFAAMTVNATPEFFASQREIGCDSELPVLIVGMPRSGTTLVEQIVSSHPEVAPGGELTFWSERAAILGWNPASETAEETVQQIAEDYLVLLRQLALGARRVTDKMPNNFQHLRLVHIVFPRARIIHCRRSPIDTCLSIYFTLFSRSTSYSHVRGDLVAFYEEYAWLMAHWRRVLPVERFLEIDYEAVVADREREARRIIAFLGLDWHEACLRHEQNANLVRTASLWQARQPIYQSSVERWRCYEPWLGEFRRLLPREISEPVQ